MPFSGIEILACLKIPVIEKKEGKLLLSENETRVCVICYFNCYPKFSNENDFV